MAPANTSKKTSSSSAKKPPKYSKHPPRATAPYLRVRTIARSGARKSVKWFQGVDWKSWWEEFFTSRRKDGRLTYLTSYGFAKKKAGKSQEQLVWIYRAIGPRAPKLEQDKKDETPGYDVPYLGDWQELRAKAYFSDNSTITRMRAEVAEAMNALQAGKGAAEIVLGLMMKFLKYDQDLDAVFGNTPVLEGLGERQLEARAKLFYKLKERNMAGVMGLLDKYLACHGIAHDGVSDFRNLVGAVVQSGANAAIQGTAAGMVLSGAAPGQGSPGDDPNSPALNALVRAVYDKHKLFSIPLPEVMVVDRRSTGAEREGEDEPNEQE